MRQIIKINTSIEYIPLVIDFTEYNNLKALSKSTKALKELNSLKLPQYTVEDKMKEYDSLVQYKQELESIKEAGKAANAKKKEINDKIKELEEKLSKFKVCPLCKRPLD